MTDDPIEQRLRAALEARAQAVTPDDLDRSREQEVADATAASTAATSARWPWRLSVAGLAAAAVVVGGLTIGQVTDSGQTPQADPLPAASETSSTTTSSPAPGRPSTTPTPSTASAMPRPSAPTSATSRPAAPRTSVPPPAAPTHSRTPAPPTTDEQPPPPGREPAPTSTSAPTSEPTEAPDPRTMAMTRSSQPGAQLRVAVATQPPAGTQVRWSATASGTAHAESSTGGVLGYTVDHGDGTTETRQVGTGCDGGAPVRPVKFSTGDQEHDYRRSGVFQVRVKVQYCSDGGKTETDTGTRTVQVP